MLRKKVTAVGTSGAILLSKDLLAILGVEIGDEVNVSVIGNQIILSSSNGKQEEDQFNEVLAKLVRKRGSAYEKLAEGPSGKTK